MKNEVTTLLVIALFLLTGGSELLNHNINDVSMNYIAESEAAAANYDVSGACSNPGQTAFAPTLIINILPITGAGAIDTSPTASATGSSGLINADTTGNISPIALNNTSTHQMTGIVSALYVKATGYYCNTNTKLSTTVTTSAAAGLMGVSIEALAATGQTYTIVSGTTTDLNTAAQGAKVGGVVTNGSGADIDGAADNSITIRAKEIVTFDGNGAINSSKTITVTTTMS